MAKAKAKASSANSLKRRRGAATGGSGGSKRSARASTGTGSGRARGPARDRGSRVRTGTAKGEALEVGDRRVDSPAAGPMRQTARKRPTGKSSRQIPGEKAVRRTEDSIPVEPPQRDGDDEPMPVEALDQRRQVVGTDEPRRTGRQ